MGSCYKHDTKLGRAVLRGMLGVDVNLSLVSDGTSSIRNEARKPQHEPNRSHHGIDLKNPFTMSKNEGLPWGNPVLHVKRGDPMSSSLGCRDGGAYRDRTDDLMLAKQPLSQLS